VRAVRRHPIILATLALGAVAPAWAVAPPAPRAAQLDRAQKRIGQLAAQTKGGPQQRLLLEREQIRRLGDDVAAGRPVDPRDIDQALLRARALGLSPHRPTR